MKRRWLQRVERLAHRYTQSSTTWCLPTITSSNLNSWIVHLQGYTAGTVSIEGPETLARALIATLADPGAGVKAAGGPGGRAWRLPLGPLSFAGTSNRQLSPRKPISNGTTDGHFSRWGHQAI